VDGLSLLLNKKLGVELVQGITVKSGNIMILTGKPKQDFVKRPASLETN
jgi:hypothetical protein